MFAGQLFDTVVKVLITIAIAAVLIALLPASPFPEMVEHFESIAGPYIGVINWVFPVGKCLKALTVWAGALLVYYAIAWILRQFDIISD